MTASTGDPGVGGNRILAEQLRDVVVAFAHVVHGERGVLVQGLGLLRALHKSGPGALALVSPRGPEAARPGLSSPSSPSLSSPTPATSVREADPLDSALAAFLKAVLLCTRGGGAASAGTDPP